MKNKSAFMILLFAAILPLNAHAQDLKPLVLPKPQTTGGKPLMQALSERQSTRSFTGEKLNPQLLSNLLWAGWGINRPDGRRTAPSASNNQEMEIYVVTPDGAYVYDAKGNQLQPVAAGDLRAATGTQEFVATAPLDLIYVADMSKTKSAQADIYAAADAAFISENIYLFCASEGLGTVVRAGIDRPALAQKLNLRDNQKIILMQVVGYPKK